MPGKFKTVPDGLPNLGAPKYGLISRQAVVGDTANYKFMYDQYGDSFELKKVVAGRLPSDRIGLDDIFNELGIRGNSFESRSNRYVFGTGRDITPQARVIGTVTAVGAGYTSIVINVSGASGSLNVGWASVGSIISGDTERVFTVTAVTTNADGSTGITVSPNNNVGDLQVILNYGSKDFPNNSHLAYGGDSFSLTCLSEARSWTTWPNYHSQTITWLHADYNVNLVNAANQVVRCWPMEMENVDTKAKTAYGAWIDEAHFEAIGRLKLAANYSMLFGEENVNPTIGMRPQGNGLVRQIANSRKWYATPVDMRAPEFIDNMLERFVVTDDGYQQVGQDLYLLCGPAAFLDIQHGLKLAQPIQYRMDPPSEFSQLPINQKIGQLTTGVYFILGGRRLHIIEFPYLGYKENSANRGVGNFAGMSIHSHTAILLDPSFKANPQAPSYQNALSSERKIGWTYNFQTGPDHNIYYQDTLIDPKSGNLRASGSTVASMLPTAGTKVIWSGAISLEDPTAAAAFGLVF